MEDYKMMVKVSLFVSIQGLYFLYIIWLRPQDSVKENLNDFINEIFYLYFVVFLLYFNSEDKWTDTTTEAYFWILMANNFILIFIMLVFLIKSLIILVRKLCNKYKVKPKQKDTTTHNIIEIIEEHKESSDKFKVNNGENSESRILKSIEGH